MLATWTLWESQVNEGDMTFLMLEHVLFVFPSAVHVMYRLVLELQQGIEYLYSGIQCMIIRSALFADPGSNFHDMHGFWVREIVPIKSIWSIWTGNA